MTPDLLDHDAPPEIDPFALLGAACLLLVLALGAIALVMAGLGALCG